MLKINKIFEESYIYDFLEKRNLLKQYKKSKQNIIKGNHSGNKLGYREPKKDGIIYFRINKQFRALGRFINKEELIIFDIDNHQN
ncbi:MAG: hypothetical protein PHI37_02880 [Candidatus Gracilibacteria bacterium]|nr:hypothetical protein [Candidatus Gracilibacteria bacterium]